MKPGPLVLLALSLFPASAQLHSLPSRLRYLRTISPKSSGNFCAILDEKVFAHAAPSLKDLRLLSSEEEIPYIITLSETSEMAGENAVLLNPKTDRALSSFDLQMPPHPYTDIDLDLNQQNFVVAATVSGSNELASSTRIPLGTFTLFDLTSRHLSRNTVLPLQESAFRYLHVELRGARIAPGAIVGAQIPPSRQAQTLFTPVAQTSILSREGNDTVATLHIPAHVPLERVSIELPPRFNGNFARTVHVTGKMDGPDGPIEAIEGHIMRVHLAKIQQQRLSFDAAMGVNLQQDATIRIVIENGDEAPLPISTVKFEMRQRNICFTAPQAAPSLFYGDPSLSAPHYAPLSKRNPLRALLSPEELNPAFVKGQVLPATHSDRFWLLLLVGFGAAGTIALHTLRKRSLHHG